MFLPRLSPWPTAVLAAALVAATLLGAWCSPCTAFRTLPWLTASDVTSMARVLPDGSRMAVPTGELDGLLCWYNALRQRKEAAVVCNGVPALVVTLRDGGEVQLCPGTDGEVLVATVAPDGSRELWSTLTREPLPAGVAG